MSKHDVLLNRLLVAGKGVNTSERQAEARVKTNDYFDLDRKELKAEGLMASVKDMESEIQGLRAAANDAGNIVLVEVYDASLSVFTRWTSAKDAA